ncbi:MAG: hypothetical protein NVS9B1_18970 [Candidatus Dormibacteraceae bacterium]
MARGLLHREGELDQRIEPDPAPSQSLGGDARSQGLVDRHLIASMVSGSEEDLGQEPDDRAGILAPIGEGARRLEQVARQ